MADLHLDRAFWEDVLKRVSRRTRDQNDAEDLLHEAFLRLERYRKTNIVENPAAFLVRTAVNIMVDNYRRKKFLEEENRRSALEPKSREPLQDEVLAARTRLERVNQGIELLAPTTREIFLMHRLDNLKYREIADRTGISESAVEKHIAKAMHFLTKWTEGW